MTCKCEPDWDVRAVCAFKTPEWKTCPVKYGTAVFYIDNDDILAINAQSNNFSFLNILEDEKLITHEDAHRIIYHWTKAWLEHEFDFEDEPSILLEAVKNYREQELVTARRIAYLEELNKGAIDALKSHDYARERFILELRIKDLKAEAEYYKLRSKNASVSP